LSHCAPGDRPASFVDWILSLPRRTGRGQPDFDRRVVAAAADGARQSARFGVTCVGDITAHPHLTRPALRDGPVRVVSYGEALGLARERYRFGQSLPRAIDDSAASDTLSVGISPHAPYTVDLPGYLECVRVARDRNVPIATHMAETLGETEFLRHQRGPFRETWEQLGGWADGVETFDGTPVQLAKAVGLLDSRALLAHVNYCDDRDLDLLAAGNASVVYCPRTHEYFGHAPHRWREMMSRGITVAIGTDSCASSPDLNVVDDLRLLRRRHPDLRAETLWRMITVNAARAVQMERSTGALAGGMFADVAAFPLLDGEDPLAAILDEPGVMPLGVWVAGRRVV
jgi:cytosine/adenosine deaminase-related metal-dependent hydrolase